MNSKVSLHINMGASSIAYPIQEQNKFEVSIFTTLEQHLTEDFSDFRLVRTISRSTYNPTTIAMYAQL